MSRKTIYFIILAIAIIILLFLSQYARSQQSLKKGVQSLNTLISEKAKEFGGYLTGGISSKTQKRGEAIQEGIDKIKERISDSGEKIENYFSGIKDAISGKENNTCPTQPDLGLTSP